MGYLDALKYKRGFWMFVVPLFVCMAVLIMADLNHGWSKTVGKETIALVHTANVLFWLFLLVRFYTQLFARAHLTLWYYYLSIIPSHWSLLLFKAIVHVCLSWMVLFPSFYRSMPDRHEFFWMKADIRASWLAPYANLEDTQMVIVNRPKLPQDDFVPGHKRAQDGFVAGKIPEIAG